MPWELALVLYGVLLTISMAAGVPLAAAIGITGIIGVTLAGGLSMWRSFADVIHNTSTSFTLVSVPLFVLMSEFILRGGIANRFYTGLARLLVRVHGSLAFSNIVGCAIFSALCGSSVATALSVGTVAIPEMRKRGYADRLTFGTLAGGGCLGILIPPSIPMVIYGSITNESVLDLFMAGVIPGILTALLFALFVTVWIRIDRTLVPAKLADGAPSVSLFQAAVDCVPVMALITAVFLSMYFGFATPTEAAAVGCLLSLLLALAFREITFRSILAAIARSAGTAAALMFITISAQILSFAVVQAGIGRGVAQAIVDSGLGPFPFMILLFIIYLILGMILDGLSLMLLTVPVLYPAAQALGFDGVWFGVIIVIFIELGALTPPMGLNLFAIQSISDGASLGAIARSSAPYAAIISISSFIFYFVPQLVLYLPSLARTFH